MTATRNTLLLRLPFVMILAILVSACVAKQDQVENSEIAAATPAYDMNSWKSIIGDGCRSFNDGCNNCFRESGQELAACTRKACSSYARPRCLDEQAAAGSARRVDYACDADSSFSVSYHEFEQDGQVVRLKQSEIVFSDHQTHQDYRLQRTPSASGEQYVDSAGFKFFGKGNEALVMERDSRLYSGCQVKQ